MFSLLGAESSCNFQPVLEIKRNPIDKSLSPTQEDSSMLDDGFNCICSIWKSIFYKEESCSFNNHKATTSFSSEEFLNRYTLINDRLAKVVTIARGGGEEFVFITNPIHSDGSLTINFPRKNLIVLSPISSNSVLKISAKAIIVFADLKSDFKIILNATKHLLISLKASLDVASHFYDATNLVVDRQPLMISIPDISLEGREVSFFSYSRFCIAHYIIGERQLRGIPKFRFLPERVQTIFARMSGMNLLYSLD